MRLLPIRKISRQSKRLALFLTFCAGYVDAYTFIVRGNTLVAGQTGNVVFLSVGLIQHNVSDASAKVMTLLSFMMGVFLLTLYKEKLRIVKKPILSLIPLAVLSIIIGFVPLSVDNIYLVPPLAFCMGLVTTAFGEVSGIAYNNAFMTGNIKRTMLAFGDYFRTKHTPFLREALIFVSLLSSFVFGVIFSAYLTIYYQEKTILGIPLMMSIFYFSMLFASWRKKGKEKA
ncbi:YoaK family protein [Streptococcus oralis]|uniref:Putative membrane protein n=1 Tax=Streptococcus mitis bv. 2 str. F0392 TaxID=768726 RepID=F9P3Y8_STROR|nr:MULTISPECIES: YoaK family protein [Streptococcus]EGR92370.1 putative membrane protein [Streptococcus mitis bv. 2 str. F0392]